MNVSKLKIAGWLLLVALPLVWLLISQNQAKMSDQPELAQVIVRETIPANGSVTATFAGGCFWCTEAVFQETPGVIAAISGYAGGQEYNPTYEQVYREQTGHREAVRVYYDPSRVSYQQLLDVYWHSIDPTDANGQFVDRGLSYTTAIFYETEEQQQAAEQSKQAIADSGKFTEPIVTMILPFTTFYEAESYHQDFYQTSSDRYETYKNASGREEFKDLIWQEIQKEDSAQ